MRRRGEARRIILLCSAVSCSKQIAGAACLRGLAYLLRHCGLKDLSQVGKVQLKMAVAESFQFSHQGAYLHCELALQKKVRPFSF